MTRTRFLPLLGTMLLAWNGVTSTAWAADKEATATAGAMEELSRSLRRQILNLNVNQVEKYQIDFNFSTFHGMYAYRELLLWASEVSQQERRGDLMAMTGAGLEAVVRDSGMGIPLAARKEGAQAVSLLFNRGLPRYVAQPDFSRPETLIWDPASFERQVSPQSVGQSLATKSLYVSIDTSDEGKALRGLLLASALEEFQAVLPLLELGGEPGASYMPALLKLEKGNWSVVNTSSLLFGQMSLLRGLAHLHTLLTNSALDNETVGGKRVAEWRKEVRRALEKVYHTTVKLHFDTHAGSFIGSHDRLKGGSGRLAAEDAGYALEVLADLASFLNKEDSLREDVLRRLTGQADYVVARLEGKTVAPKTFLVSNQQTYAGLLLQIDDQLAIVTGLLAAHQATAKERYSKAALTIFSAARETLWSVPAGIFRSASGQTVSAYDGHLFGLALAAWRRAEKLLPPGEARQHGEQLIEAVLKQGGLQQAEGPATGETKQPEDFIEKELPQLVSTLAALKKEEQPAKAVAAVKALSDQDGDGIPGCRFGGGRFGAAPVLIIQTSVKTPFDPPPANTTTPRSAP